MRRILLLLFVLCLLSFLFFLVFFNGSYLYDISVQLGVFFLGALLVWKNSLKETLASIGFPGPVKTTAIYFVSGMLILFATLFVLSAAAIHFGFNDQSKVAQKVLGLPWYILFVAIVIAPVAEELLFRAALIPRIGTIPATVLFSVAHFSYGSVVEIAGTFLIGLLLSFIFKRSKSITPGILMHITYNLLSILALRFVS